MLIVVIVLTGIWFSYKGIIVNSGNFEWVKEDGSPADSNSKDNLRHSVSSPSECRNLCYENTSSCNAWTYNPDEGNHNCWGYKEVKFRKNAHVVGYESGEVCKIFNLSSCFNSKPKLNPNK